MRALVQRVNHACVSVGDSVVGRIDHGLLVFVGIADHDRDEQVEWMSRKLVGIRIFRDDDRLMNRSVVDVDGSILLVSQFTLYASVDRGLRPGFDRAASGEIARPIFDQLVASVKKTVRVETGTFGADMRVELENDGPVTLFIER